MASQAINTQGTTLEIATGSGAAKTISGIAKGARTRITATAHGLGNGDVVTFAGVVGMTQINGLSAAIKSIDANTFDVDIDSSAFTAYTSGGTATPVAWTLVGEIKSINDLDSGETSEIEVTHVGSTAKEYILGLKDSGTMSLELNRIHGDAGQAAMVAARDAATARDFRIKLPGGLATYSLAALVKRFSISALGVDQAYTAQASLRVTGAVTIT